MYSSLFHRYADVLFRGYFCSGFLFQNNDYRFERAFYKALFTPTKKCNVHSERKRTAKIHHVIFKKFFLLKNIATLTLSKFQKQLKKKQREGRNEKHLLASADQCMISNCRSKLLARYELSLWKEVLVGKSWSGRALGASQVKLTQSHTD